MSTQTRTPRSRGRHRWHRAAVVALVGPCAFLTTGCLGDDPMSSLPTALPTALPSVTALPTLPATPSLPALRPEGEDSATAEPGDTTTPGTQEPAGEGVSGAASAPGATADEGGRPPDDTTEDGARQWWPRLVAAAALLAVGALVFSQRRARTRRAWDARLESVASHMRWVETSVVDRVLTTPNTAQAAATWQSAGPHLHSIGSELDSLCAADIDGGRRHGAQRLRDAFSDLALAVDRETSPTPGDSVEALGTRRADVVRAREVLRTVLEEVAAE